MGYGPLVRCARGTTSLWRYPEDDAGYSDGATIYPDHFAAEVGAVALLAALIGRRDTGHGTHTRSSQAEAILVQMSDLVLAESLRPGTAAPAGNQHPAAAPWGVYPCAGDDEWCVITVRDESDWAALRSALGEPDWAQDPALANPEARVARRAEIDDHLTAWTLTRTPREAAAVLQAAGVPAGFMQRPEE
jgi:crotonobetainyl-CoA:carnitine CoA-transferase CaiB-like acyl-CoA transferase